jgi:hypothetical protein
MRERKLIQNQIQTTEGMKFQLLNQKMALENAKFSRSIIQTLDEGNKAMVDLRGNWDADKVHDVLDATRDELDTQDEIANAFVTHAANGFDEVPLYVISHS